MRGAHIKSAEDGRAPANCRRQFVGCREASSSLVARSRLKQDIHSDALFFCYTSMYAAAA